MRRIFSILFAMFLVVQINAQSRDSTDKYLGLLPEYEVVNPLVYEILDSLVFYTNSCIYKIMNKPYLFSFRFFVNAENKVEITVESMEYHFVIMDRVRSMEFLKQGGFFYYNDILVLIEDDDNVSDIFFRNTHKETELYYTDAMKFSSEWRKGYELVRINYKYIDGQLRQDYIIRCNKRPYLNYTIKEGDTWESISQKCGCPVEVLQIMYVPQKKRKKIIELIEIKDIFIPGEKISVQYFIKDSRVSECKRVWFK